MNNLLYSEQLLKEMIFPQSLLTNDLLDDYLRLLQTRNTFHLAMAASWQVRSSEPKILVLPTSFSIIASNQNNSQIVNPIVSTENIFAADVIIIPTLAGNGQHWALVVVDIATRQIRWYDWDRSHLICDGGFTFTVKLWLKREALAQNLPDAEEFANFSVVKAYDGPTTCPPGGCGPLTLLVATLIAEGIPVSEASKKNALENFRFKIADMLMDKPRLFP